MERGPEGDLWRKATNVKTNTLCTETPWLTHRNVPSSSEAQGKPSQSVYVSDCLVSGKVSLKGLSSGLSVDAPAECLV